MMAHAAASRRTRNDRGYPFDMPTYAVSRRMMYPPMGGGGEGYPPRAEDDLAHFGISVPMQSAMHAHGGMGRYPAAAQAIDIDFTGGKVGRKQTEVKKELVIFPRRKAGQSKRQADNEAPVKLTPESLEEIANIPLVAAAKKLGISKTALKNACRNLGLKRWPFRRRREDARRKAAIDGSTRASGPGGEGNDKEPPSGRGECCCCCWLFGAVRRRRPR